MAQVYRLVFGGIKDEEAPTHNRIGASGLINPQSRTIRQGGRNRVAANDGGGLREGIPVAVIAPRYTLTVISVVRVLLHLKRHIGG
jgi:hypothetical protein